RRYAENGTSARCPGIPGGQPDALAGANPLALTPALSRERERGNVASRRRRRNLASGEAQAAQPRACCGLLNGRVFEMGALAPTSRAARHPCDRTQPAVSCRSVIAPTSVSWAAVRTMTIWRRSCDTLKLKSA